MQTMAALPAIPWQERDRDEHAQYHICTSIAEQFQ